MNMQMNTPAIYIAVLSQSPARQHLIPMPSVFGLGINLGSTIDKIFNYLNDIHGSYNLLCNG